MVTQTSMGARAQRPYPHREAFPSMYPVPPIRPAPARFGAAGISAGEDRFFKDTITLRPESPMEDITDPVAQGLGWFSIGLGAAEIVAGRSIAQWLGMDGKSPLLRFYGVREIGAGIGILAQNRPKNRAPWLWARVAGDVLDLATLAPGLRHDNPRRDRVQGAIGVVAAITAVDLLCASLLSAPRPQARA